MSVERSLSRYGRVALALGVSIVLSCAILALFSDNFLAAFEQFFIEPFSNRYFLGNLIADTIPLIISGLGVLLAFRSRNFNLGGEGQIYAGALAAGALVLRFDLRANPLAVWLSAMIVGTVIGGFIGALSGFLKAYRRVTEMISSFLLSAIIINVSDYIITGPLQDPQSNFQTTRHIASNFLLPTILSPSKLNISLILAIALVLVVSIIATRTKIGFELKIYGENEEFARYCRINVVRYEIMAMVLSGALYGLSGALLVLGPQARVMRGFTSGLGWSAISVALLAQGSEAAIIPAAFFIAYLSAGSNHVMIGSGVPSEIISLLQAVALFFITAQAFPALHSARKRT